MQRQLKQAGSTSIADLRASLRTTSDRRSDSPRPPKPPKPRKNARVEDEDARIAKAEKAAMLQHTTSLLKGGNSKKRYVRPGERAERKGGLFWQLILVMLVAGGVACALDPSLIPHGWIEKARELARPYIKF